MDQVLCNRFEGGTIAVSRNELVFRPSAYGIVTHARRMLLVRDRFDRLFYPGGAIEPGETIAEAIEREIMEETGHTVKVGPLMEIRESFFYYTPEKVAWHCHCFFYLCELVSDPDIEMKGEQEDVEGRPEWIEIETLDADRFLDTGMSVFWTIRDRI